MTTLTILFYVIGIIISWIIFYYVVKAAVRNGIKEALPNKEVKSFNREPIHEIPMNDEQAKLQQRYDRGEITFEVFKSEWNKLSS